MVDTLKREMRKGIDEILEIDLYSNLAPKNWLFSRNA